MEKISECANKSANRKYEVKEIGQVAEIIKLIKTNPESRRMVITAWGAGERIKSKLPPCHYTFVFNVTDGKLNCHLTQRSGDIALEFHLTLRAILY